MDKLQSFNVTISRLKLGVLEQETQNTVLEKFGKNLKHFTPDPSILHESNYSNLQLDYIYLKQCSQECFKSVNAKHIKLSILLSEYFFCYENTLLLEIKVTAILFSYEKGTSANDTVETLDCMEFGDDVTPAEIRNCFSSLKVVVTTDTYNIISETLYFLKIRSKSYKS